MSNYIETQVICPFFKKYKRKQQIISCEGIPHTAAANLMFFETAVKADRYLENRCCKDYMECPVAGGILEKYR